jgi:multisubunit Na+/H+ antiporter MnhE subunit
MSSRRLLFWTVLLFSMWLILTSNFQMPNILVGTAVSLGFAQKYTHLKSTYNKKNAK